MKTYEDIRHLTRRPPGRLPAKSIDSDFSKGYQTPTRSLDMKKHLFWILPVVLAAVVLPFVVRPRSHAENFERLMASGRGSFEKGDYTNAVRYYQQAVKARAGEPGRASKPGQRIAAYRPKRERGRRMPAGD